MVVWPVNDPVMRRRGAECQAAADAVERKRTFWIVEADDPNFPPYAMFTAGEYGFTRVRNRAAKFHDKASAEGFADFLAARIGEGVVYGDDVPVLIARESGHEAG